MTEKTKRNLVAPIHNGLLSIGLGLALLSTVSVPASNAKVGITAAVNQLSRGTAPGAAPRVKSIAEDVVFNEQIETNENGLVQILLVDGTTFTVGPSSSLTIDKFVYDPDKGEAEAIASVARGAFRLIGGLATRRRGSFRINTPSGTMGIRGAMVELVVDKSRDQTLIRLVFGDEVTFTGNSGQISRLFEPGYVLEVRQEAGVISQRIRRGTLADAQLFQSNLSGRSGTSGGSSNTPSDSVVAVSPVTSENSAAPTQVTTPTPRPAPVKASDIDTVQVETDDVDVVTEDAIRSGTIDQASDIDTVQVEMDDVDVVTEDAIRSGTIDQPTQQPGPDLPTRQARILGTGDTDIFTWTFPSPPRLLPDAGSRGLVGSSTGLDQTVALTQDQGRFTYAGMGLTLDFPDFSGTQGDSGLTAFAVTDGVYSPDVPLTGTAYAGVEDFVFYQLRRNDDVTQPFYAILGTGIDLDAPRDDGEASIREYTLTRDPILQLPVPYFNNTLYGDLGNYNSTNLLVAEADDDSARGEVFQSWIDITGSGTAQKSAVGLVAAGLSTDDDGTILIRDSRRGSFRTGAALPSTTMKGSFSTIAGPDGRHFFGPNAEHAVLGTSLLEDIDDTYLDHSWGQHPGLARGGTGYVSDGRFTTVHVADLASETERATFGRTARTHRGYMVGVAEALSQGPDSKYAVMSGTAGSDTILASSTNFVVGIDASTSRLGAQADVNDVFDQDAHVAGLDLTFGRTSTDSGGSAFIDDDRFGAVHNRNRALTRLRGDLGQDVQQVSEYNAGSYLVSGRAAPIAGYQHCTTCDFMDWGWWGSEPNVESDGTLGQPSGARRADHVHLGTWVAGDITNRVDLPTFGSATYAGTAMATVVDVSAATNSPTYISRGGFGMDFNFASRTGTASITGVAGMSATGAVAENIMSGTDATFSGDISGTSVVGALSGNFTNDGAAIAEGVLGQFVLGDTVNDLGAVGTFMGRRQ